MQERRESGQIMFNLTHTSLGVIAEPPPFLREPQPPFTQLTQLTSALSSSKYTMEWNVVHKVYNRMEFMCLN